jgi:hypothetical protein
MMILLLAAAAAQVPPVAAAAPRAASQAAAKPVDPAALASARKLLALMHVDQTIDRMMGSLVPVMTSAVVGSLDSNDTTRAVMQQMESQLNGRERLMAIFSEEIGSGFRAAYPSIIDSAAHEYASRFTKQELDEIVAFYSSGTGAKVVELMPQIQQGIGASATQIGRTVGQEAGLKAMQRAVRELLPSNKVSS